MDAGMIVFGIVIILLVFVGVSIFESLGKK